MSDSQLTQLRQLHMVAQPGSGLHGFFQLDVIGVLREDTVISKCGSIVHLETVFGRLTLDDSDMHFSAALYEKIWASLGLPSPEDPPVHFDSAAEEGRLRALHANKRYLAPSGLDFQGFFDFLEEYNWQCTSVTKPALDVENFKAHVRVEYPCAEEGCFSELDTLFAVGTRKPGLMPELASPEDAGLVRVPKIYAEQWQYRFKGVFWSVIQYPNHPLQTVVDVQMNGTYVRYQQFLNQNQFFYCREGETPKSSFDVASEKMRSSDKEQLLNIQFLGFETLTQETQPKAITRNQNINVRKFKIRAQTDDIAEAYNILPLLYYEKIDEAGGEKKFTPYYIGMADELEGESLTSYTFMSFEGFDGAAAGVSTEEEEKNFLSSVIDFPLSCSDPRVYNGDMGI